MREADFKPRGAESKLANYPSENQVTQLWRRQLLNRTRLVTESGQPIEVIYPGRINDDRGADFRDAVVATRREIVKGDIEIHVRSSDWHDHGHDGDSNYNGVILHVVMWHNSQRATTLQNGREVPVLALAKHIKTPVGQELNLLSSQTMPSLPCGQAVQFSAPEAIARFLDEAGEARFLGKVAGFQTKLAQIEAGQVLYEGIMEALGYAKNKLPFLKLARRLPLRNLEAIAQSQVSDRTCRARLQALLLGTAGLRLSTQIEGKTGKRMEERRGDKLGKLSREAPVIEPMSPQAWQPFKVRPQNSPAQRLAAMSYLLPRYRKEGILEELTSKIKEIPVRQGYRILEQALVVTTLGNRRRSVTLLGRERAADIIINVLLPFSCAWGQFTGYPELGQKALDLYRHYPRRTVNSIERHMSHQLGLSRQLVSSAQRQQGLIHIYRSFCTQGRCGDCVLGQP